MLNPDYQYHLHIKKGDVGRYAIIPGDPGRCENIASYLDHAKQVAYNREYCIYTGSLEGEMVSVCSSGIGGPSLAIAIQELHLAGADTFIRVGTCGGMQLNVLPGELVIGSGAIRMEGTSKEYLPIEFPAVADFNVVCALKSAADSLGCKPHIGVLECKDSFYGQQTPEVMPVSYELLNKWQAWIKGGALASEMESAALYTISSYLRLRAGTVSLVIHNQERRAKGMYDDNVFDTTMAIRTGVEAIRQLVLQDRHHDQAV